jgi:hypothetical protein
VLTGDGVGVDGESQVLMNARVRPPDAARVGVLRLVRRDAALPAQAPHAPLLLKRHARHQLPLRLLALLARLPAAHVMTARDDAGPYAFRHPRADDEVAALGLDADEVAGRYT